VLNRSQKNHPQNPSVKSMATYERQSVLNRSQKKHPQNPSVKSIAPPVLATAHTLPH
jgi:hypothetical protein